ncbi:SatD family protein [Carnobacterium jeotgali]|uniref:SatD family protein n=1 Tax=Carnobacterium jeotgali TaxID=545534 RepID=UPI00068A2629|nr:SatD family protein [Carnobacterium jeotgali]
MTRQTVRTPYAAIIGDIKDSRKIADRKEVQEQFHSILQIINEKYAEDIASNFIITLGDSFQGLLKNKQVIFKHYF